MRKVSFSFTRNTGTWVVILAALVLSPGLVVGDNPTRPKGIMNSPHNLSYNSPVRAGRSSEICVFCHTPHSAIITVSTASLWNHTTPTQAYLPFGSGTLNASPSRSLICLSCHDGQIASSELRNPSWQFAIGSRMPSVSGDRETDASLNVGNAAGARVMLNMSDGSDFIKHDHPVGVAYPLATTYDSATAPTFNQNINVAPYSLPIDGTVYINPWSSTAFTTWNSNPANAPMPKQKVTLYYNASSQPTVECLSCHDVHNANGLANLLSESNDANALWLDCHYNK